MSFGNKTKNRSLLPERGPLKPTAVDLLQDTLEGLRQTDRQTDQCTVECCTSTPCADKSPSRPHGASLLPQPAQLGNQ